MTRSATDPQADGRPVRPVGLRRGAAASVAAVVAVETVIGRSHGNSSAQAVSDIAILTAALVDVPACLRAAGRGGPYYGFTRDHAYPFPSPADLFYLGYRCRRWRRWRR